MNFRKLSLAAAALIPLGLAAPVAGASADTAPAAPLPAITASGPLMTFVPPGVKPIQVLIGPTIIDGQQISPGVNVISPGISLPPITWTPPF